MKRVKEPAIAGTWYPGDPHVLEEQIEGLLDRAAGAGGEDSVALIVPHAAYRYSGQAAAHAYATLRGRNVERVVILAPSHFGRARAVSVAPWDAFRTPLGLVEVDRGACRELVGRALVREDAGPFANEHSLEIQIPFLQRVLGRWRLVPLLVGGLRAEDHEAVAAALAPLADGATVWVVSSDFTHYGADFGYLPFAPEGAEEVRRRLRALDGGAIERVAARDFEGFLGYLEETGVTICGARPIATFLRLPLACRPGELLSYYTSLDVTGDYHHTVSYAGIRFARAQA